MADMQRRFVLNIRVIRRDQTNEGIIPVQNYLRKFGYLSGRFMEGTLDAKTSEALIRFQRVFGLEETGELNEETSEAMEMPRCGVPDLSPSISALDRYVLIGCNYNKINFTYQFVNGTDDINDNDERQPVRNAFQTWSNVISVNFTEVPPNRNADFRIGWFVRDHGDGSPFDDSGNASVNVLAHAFYPPPCGGANSGDMHFDDYEVWNLTGIRGIDLETVALHEIGHLLGLAHSLVRNSVMFNTYSGVRRQLTSDDIAGIQELYGRRNAEIYTTDRISGLRLLMGHNWRNSWSLIVPGNFSGGGHTDLLFYDSNAGVGEFYTTDGQGNLVLLRQHNWRNSWGSILPGEFGDSMNTDLVFYG